LKYFSKKNNPQKKICFVSSSGFGLVQFRLSLIKKLNSDCFLVNAISSDITKKQLGQLNDIDVNVDIIESSRTSLGVMSNLLFVFSVYNLIKKIKPDICFTFFHKPNLFAIPISKLLRIKTRILMVEGLGYVYLSKSLHIRFIVRPIVTLLYCLSFHMASKIIVLNNDDKEFVKNLLFFNHRKVHLINGIGVSLKNYTNTTKPQKEFDFIFIGRFLEHKGIYEFIDAIKILKSQSYDFNAVLVGDVDANPSSVDIAQINNWEKLNLIKNLGYSNNVNELLFRSKVLVLPSHREALPRVCQEAAVAGVPSIVANTPGCKDVVIDNKTGFVVPKKDPHKLAMAMKKYLNDKDLLNDHSLKAAQNGKKYFDEDSINLQFIKLINDEII
jgi:glycosyltransferase involved in cell wall biosynthesis